MASGAVLVHDVSLEPGDRILLYSDGVVESRDEAGEEFGLQRFTDHIIRSTAAGQSAPEALRKRNPSYFIAASFCRGHRWS